MLNGNYKNIRLGEYFLAAEISGYLTDLVQKVLHKISTAIDINDIKLGFLYEGPTFFNEIAEVTEDGDININSERLKNLDENVALALIAHEFAHVYHHHYEG